MHARLRTQVSPFIYLVKCSRRWSHGKRRGVVALSSLIFHRATKRFQKALKVYTIHVLFIRLVQNETADIF